MTFELSGGGARWEILMAGARAPLWIKLDENFTSGCGLVGCTSLKKEWRESMVGWGLRQGLVAGGDDWRKGDRDDQSKSGFANMWIYDMLMWIQSLKMIGCDVMCQRMCKVGIILAGARPNQWLKLCENWFVVVYKVCLPVVKIWWFGEWLLRLAPGMMFWGGDDWRKGDSDEKFEMWIDRYV